MEDTFDICNPFNLPEDMEELEDIMSEFNPTFVLITELLAAKEVKQTTSACLETACGEWHLCYNATPGVVTDSRGSKVWPWLIVAYKGNESEARVSIGALDTDLPIDEDETQFLIAARNELGKYLS